MDFKQLRKSRGISQQELAQAVGVTNRAISMWETGNSLPQTPAIPIIAAVLKVSEKEVLDCFVKNGR